MRYAPRSEEKKKRRARKRQGENAQDIEMAGAKTQLHILVLVQSLDVVRTARASRS